MSPRLFGRRMAAQADVRLLALAREGHEDAFEAIVKRYRLPLLRYCASMGLSSARAEDVLQQALLQAWVAIGRGTEVRELKPWLYRIVHNTAINAVRKSRDELTALDDTDAIDATMPGADSILERALAVRDTLGDVAALPQMQREALLLTALDGRTHEEVARALGISDGAVRGLIYRARVALRAAALAVMPAPLAGWASRCLSRAASACGRLGELTSTAGPGGASGLLVRGAAVAVTAAFAAGAVLVPEHLRHASAKRLRVPAAELMAPDGTASAAAPHVGYVLATARRPISVAASYRGSGAPSAIAVSSPSLAVAPAPERANSPHGLSPGLSTGASGVPPRAPSVTAGAGGKAASSGNVAEATPPAGPVSPPGGGSGTGGKTGSEGSGGSTGSGGSEGGKQHEEGGSGSKGSDEEGGDDQETGGKSEGAGSGERAESEAEQARERRESEAEQAREQRELEAEKAAERREREAEAASEKSGDS
jgi:RNA polymerase sigma factor (sigma-70 family)